MPLPSSPRAIVTRWAERLLFTTGGLCLGLAVLGWGEAAAFQRVLDWRLERALIPEGAGAPASSSFAAPLAGHGQAGATPAEVSKDASRDAVARRAGDRDALDAAIEQPIGRLVAPRLGLSVVVAEGISGRTLRRAVGHIPGTALPWEDGNVGLAAHRDTFFWRLKDVKVGDTLRLVTPRGRFEYVVRSLHVVAPDRADLLDPSESPRLTLVTCYPFSVVGPAPSRLVVTADRTSPGPAPAAWMPGSAQ